jgi:hypothetical protein
MCVTIWSGWFFFLGFCLRMSHTLLLRVSLVLQNPIFAWAWIGEFFALPVLKLTYHYRASLFESNFLPYHVFFQRIGWIEDERMWFLHV